jgi:hypothetical protein
MQRNRGFVSSRVSQWTGVRPLSRFESVIQLWRQDPFVDFLRLAIPFNTAFSFQDVSATIKGTGANKVVTAVNGAAISTSVSKFYGASLDNGTVSQNRYVSTPNNSDLVLTNSDFTIEGWFYFTANNIGYQVMASHGGDSTDAQNGWVLIIEANNTVTFLASDNGGWDVSLSSSQIPTINVWHHIAVTRSGNVFRLFYNGIQIATQTISVTITSPSSREFRLGSYAFIPSPPKSLNGFAQDFRLYTGTGSAKYTSNFTPPNSIYLL